MKISATLLAAFCLVQASSAFTTVLPHTVSRVSAVKPLSYGWDAVNKPAAPAAPPAAAAPPVVEEEKDVDTDGVAPMGGAWGTTYDPATDVIPSPPAGARSWEEIYSEFQAKKASGAFNTFKNIA
mmetsp:Transcript_4395/g.4915  ORF Transcript_4395/g.4915 Transcript_4395/m.4915 type:complete len:125 (+) Transcript_4395:68-442(+)